MNLIKTHIEFHFLGKLERQVENMYIENIVIGKPIVDPSTMFATDEDDWNKVEKEKT